MPKISAVVPDELGAALEKRARENDRSVSAEVRRALAAHLGATRFRFVPPRRSLSAPDVPRTPPGAVEPRRIAGAPGDSPR